jgi:hypothetical protein
MLEKIVRVAQRLPTIKFWLPTRERKILAQWKGKFPPNLIVRVSANKIGTPHTQIKGTVSSTVGSGTGFICPAHKQDNQCKDCRACWDRKVKSVDYKLH